jgi:lysylphosphatidylglycerol synthetase-like protein (DUF2156 family)
MPSTLRNDLKSPQLIFPATPKPPFTTNAPVVVLLDAVVLVVLIVPAVANDPAFTAPAIPAPPATVSAPVVVVVEAVVLEIAMSPVALAIKRATLFVMTSTGCAVVVPTSKSVPVRCTCPTRVPAVLEMFILL